jgi:hypothetical protein
MHQIALLFLSRTEKPVFFIPQLGVKSNPHMRDILQKASRSYVSGSSQLHHADRNSQSKGRALAALMHRINSASLVRRARYEPRQVISYPILEVITDTPI